MYSHSNEIYARIHLSHDVLLRRFLFHFLRHVIQYIGLSCSYDDDGNDDDDDDGKDEDNENEDNDCDYGSKYMALLLSSSILSIYQSIYVCISYQSLIPQYSQMPSSSPHLDVRASFVAFPSTNQCV